MQADSGIHDSGRHENHVQGPLVYTRQIRSHLTPHTQRTKALPDQRWPAPLGRGVATCGTARARIAPASYRHTCGMSVCCWRTLYLLHSDANSFANRTVRGLARGDRNQKPLNDRQRTHFRGVRVALGTGYSHGERGRRAWRNAPTRRCPCAGHCPTLLLLLLRRRRRRLLRRRAQRWRAQDDGAWPPPHPGDTAGRERQINRVSRRKYHAAKGGEGERTG